MEIFVTQLHTSKFSFFPVAILFCILSINGVHAKEISNAVNVNSKAIDTKNKNKAAGLEITIDPLTAVTGLKISSATITATINDPDDNITDRGIVWSINPDVKMTDHPTSIPGSVHDGSFSVNMTGLVRSRTIYYRAYYTDNDGLSMSLEYSFSNVPVFKGIGDWDDATKWNVNEIPGSYPSDSPVIDGICTIANVLCGCNASWICGNLTINSGASLTINPGKSIEVNGTLLNNAAETGIVLKSDATGSATLRYRTGTPLATVEMYSKASWDLNQPDGSKYSWQYFGIPVTNFTLNASTFPNSFVRQYDETSTDDAGLWKFQSNNSTLTSGTGYELVQASPKTYIFTGTLTNAEIVNQPIVSSSGALYPGQHVFANPYTAAIDISKITLDPATTEQSVYLYNTGTYNQWYENDAFPSDGLSSLPGQYTVSSINTAGKLGVPGQIPSMQGFVVKTLSLADGSISIPYFNSTITSTELQRTKKVVKTSTSENVATRIDLTCSHITDCLWLFTDPSCSANYDNGWDGYKMIGSVKTPQLYAMEEAGDFQIDALADINGTFLGFSAGDETNYKLTFTHLNTENQYKSIFLVDLLENKTTDITTSGSEYAFTAVSTPTAVKRFKIVTSPLIATSTTFPVSSKLKVFNSNSTLFVQNLSDQNGYLILYTMNGVAVKKMDFKANIITTFSTTNLLPGAYVAKAFSTQEMVTEKIIIR